MSQLTILRCFIQKQQRYILPLLLEQQKLQLSRYNGTLWQKIKQSQEQQQTQRSSGALQESSGRTDVSTDVRPLGEKIKENTKTASYTAIIIAGIGVTAVMFYAIFRELFSSSSPNNIYSDALERAKNDYRVQDAIGAPIKGFGEESRRGRRQHVAHQMYDRNGVPHMRMQFYIQGLRNKATVHLESRKTSSGKMEYRYLFVQLNHYPHTTIILEDNRAFDAQQQETAISAAESRTQDSFNGSGLEFATFKSKK